jgi:uncharacterized cupin superfamily protein
MSESKRHPNLINVNESPEYEIGRGKFGAKARRLAAPTGGKQVGCTWYEVPPGKTAFPRHFHTGIEEALFVLSGEGELRLGESSLSVKAGDYVTLPPGPEHPHALKNTGASPLQYLALSNQNTVDVVGYPDSKKFLFLASPTPELGPWVNPWANQIVKQAPSVDYFEGEELEEK